MADLHEGRTIRRADTRVRPYTYRKLFIQPRFFIIHYSFFIFHSVIDFSLFIIHSSFSKDFSSFILHFPFNIRTFADKSIASMI